jgi:hypothetical protein
MKGSFGVKNLRKVTMGSAGGVSRAIPIEQKNPHMGRTTQQPLE